MSKSFLCALKCNIPTTSNPNKTIVHGAKERHLKNICFELPKGKLIALTGPSGSGKSSIAIEVLQKECLRQYLESLGMTTDHIPKAKVNVIMGLAATVGVSQRVTDFNPRSTVGTRTGILAILRNLFASIGRQKCNGCNKSVKQPLQDKSKLTTIEIEEKKANSSKKRKKSYFDCPNCNKQLEKLTMGHFSSNTMDGACKSCKGAGQIIEFDIPNLLHEEKTITDGGVDIWDTTTAQYYENVIQAAIKHYNIPFDTMLSIKDYNKEQRNFLLYGITFPDFVQAYKNIKPPKKVSDGKFEGIIPNLLNRYKNNPSKIPNDIKKYIVHTPCLKCHNTGLGTIGREATINDKNITNTIELNLNEFLEWITTLKKHVVKEEIEVVAAFSSSLKDRTLNLIEVGLDYLTLSRPLPSLSGGESQRIRLASVIGSGLTGMLYVLDEPTTGLHPHDTVKLLQTIRSIQKAGNTVLVIEHDPDVIKSVDYIMDIGPGGGSKGGEIIVSGTPAEVMACTKSITGKYLAKKNTIQLNDNRSRTNKALTIRGACEHNLKNVDVSIPVNQFVVMTGVSGSGKSTFLFDIVDKIARKHFNNARVEPGKYNSAEGLDHFNRIVTVDQSTIRNTKSSRSNVATYTKLFDLIRDLFASLPEAKTRKLGTDIFSFNTSPERCENCNGAGTVAIDMSFVDDIEIECPSCDGMRFNENVLSIKFKEHSISDILNLTINDAIPLFNEKSQIFGLLDIMQQVGLGYLTLGQSTSTLSGGEAQRIKLAKELSKSGKESTLYLLDEPTNGLHPQEIEKLLKILKKLVAKGNTVITIEHNLDVIAQADTIIDFGPKGGSKGGTIVATGTPQEIIANKDSLTGQCLKIYLDQSTH